MKNKKESFASLMQSFGYRYDLRAVFNDFLTMTLCAFSQNPITGKSHEEELYMETVARYQKPDVHLFSQMLSCLVCEMEDRLEEGNDVLGDFYEQNFCRRNAGQFFTPWQICMLIAQSMSGDSQGENVRKRILDPTCGSGRMLLAGAKTLGKQHLYYGIDIDATCVQMAVINIFLNGMFGGEVMCADALHPDDFRFSYQISFLPFGVFRIKQKEQSPLWHQYRNSLERKEKAVQSEILLPSASGEEHKEGSQLLLF